MHLFLVGLGYLDPLTYEGLQGPLKGTNCFELAVDGLAGSESNEGGLNNHSPYFALNVLISS